MRSSLARVRASRAADDPRARALWQNETHDRPRCRRYPTHGLERGQPPRRACRRCLRHARRRGATLATGVAVIAGRHRARLRPRPRRLHGTARSIWLVVGALFLLIGVLWPLRGARPASPAADAGELRRREDAAEATDAGPPRRDRHGRGRITHTPSGAVVPSIVTQSQRFTSLRQLAGSRRPHDDPHRGAAGCRRAGCASACC